MPSGLFLDYVDPWVNWTWLSTHIPLFVAAVEQHLTLTVIAVAGGLAISIPLGIAAHRWRALRNPVLAFFDVVYTIPSLALFALLVPYTGLGVVTAGLGQLINRGLIENFHTPLVVATVLSIALALVADLLLVGAQRLAIPWSRGAAS